MRNRIVVCLTMMLVVVVAGGCNRGSAARRLPATSRPGAMSEDEKIEALIDAVSRTKDVTFIRNGSEYNASAAAQLMQYKWNRDRRQIKTARDFVRVAGTKSSTTGRIYEVRLKVGRVVSSEEFLMGKLAEIEGTRR